MKIPIGLDTRVRIRYQGGKSSPRSLQDEPACSIKPGLTLDTSPNDQEDLDSTSSSSEAETRRKDLLSGRDEKAQYARK